MATCCVPTCRGPHGEAGSTEAVSRDGRTWDRIETRAERPEPTLDDFLGLLQGFLVDADGRPITLSTTRIHSALGQIRDMAAAGDLGRIVEAVVRELRRS
jgi:hypothetical protein